MYRPDTVEDEEELYEDTAEGQHPAHHDARHATRAERLAWDQTRRIIGAHGVLNGLTHTNAEHPSLLISSNFKYFTRSKLLERWNFP